MPVSNLSLPFDSEVIWWFVVAMAALHQISYSNFFFLLLSLPLEHRASVKRSVSLQFLNLIDSRRTPWMSDQLDARPLSKLRTTQTQNKHIHTPNIHALSWIRTHDPGFRASEDSTCLRPLGNRDRPYSKYTNLISDEFTELVETCSLHLTASLNNYCNVRFANVSQEFLNATDGKNHMILLKCELKETI
jgi:hypothetical protein